MKSPFMRMKVLRFVAEQGVVRVSDVMDYFRRWDSEHAVRVMMNELGIRHQQYGDFKYGIWFIDDKKIFELLKPYYKDIPDFKVRGTSLLTKVAHSLGINHIRIILENSEKIRVVKWWSEEYLRALPPFRRDGISMHKIPDAIFWHLRKDGSKQKFFLEYERSLKAPKRYAAIFQFYDKRHDVKNNNVIYICETDSIKVKLEKTENELTKGGKIKGSGLNFKFVTLDEFNKAYSVTQKKGETK
ncbi:MAG: hypothetical protein KAJ18_05665 [Candidatus Omnitrophica bacterium]|nr:hypothetical protein [Candidatus Omnitrophota bacterium]